MDNATAMGSQPSVARILAKLDVTKTFPEYVWLGPETYSHVQKVVFETFPSFCSHCKALGHKKSACLILHPHLRKFIIPKSVLITTYNNPIIVGDFDNVPLNDHNVVLDNVHLDNELLASPVKPLIDGLASCLPVFSFYISFCNSPTISPLPPCPSSRSRVRLPGPLPSPSRALAIAPVIPATASRIPR
ncbi:hypothetical protein IEQ34_019106 [Dendrobium chrysotoxum]|uniref:Uncharacterized protein n=1 Tax=Dendrobium chrysotoxum TaxID=161865 RepID=A0AAV7G7W3_DENCH|nr:hypothetical protein IEQ34_019106 [Dendrobium chrysotoxum]